MAKKKLSKDKKQLEEKKEEVKIDERAAFNCPTCEGDGLVEQGTKLVLCTNCSGTGKI